MYVFSNLLSILKGGQSFPQPIRRALPIALLLTLSFAPQLLVPFLPTRTYS